MAAAVATPLERQFSGIAGIDSMNSTSSQSSTNITLQFSLDRDIDAAAQDVQTAIASTLSQLPPSMPTPPNLRKVNPSSSPILFVVLSSPTLPMSEVDEWGETVLAQRISTVNGVAQVNIYGSKKYAVRVQADPGLLASRSIGIDELATAISAGNSNQPVGIVYGPRRALTVQTNGRLVDAAAYRPLVIAYRNGAPVRLGEVANVLDSVENDRQAAWFQGDRSIVLAIQRQPDSNTIQVVDKVRALFPAFRLQLPAAMRMDVMYDRSEGIRESVRDVQLTLGLTICLVVLVIFLFLRNLRSTFIPSIALPTSLFGTFAVMAVLGFSLDNSRSWRSRFRSDRRGRRDRDAGERRTPHGERGERGCRAARVAEIGFTILSMTISSWRSSSPSSSWEAARTAVQGVGSRSAPRSRVGFRVADAHADALQPALRREEPGGMHGKSRPCWAVLRPDPPRLRATLHVVLRHRRVTLATLVAWRSSRRPLQHRAEGFIPNEDIGFLRASIEGLQESRTRTCGWQRTAAEIVRRAGRAVRPVLRRAGGPNASETQARCSSRSNRESAPLFRRIIDRLRPKLAVEGLRFYLRTARDLDRGRTRSQYQLTLQSTDTDVLYANTTLLERKMHGLRS